MFHDLKPRKITNAMRQALPFRQLPENNILIIADWHYRLRAEWGEIRSRLPSADIALLLGDIGYSDAKALTEAAPPDVPMLYILGNHNVWSEYRRIPRLQPLDRKVIEINGIRFGGISGSNRYSDSPKRVMRTEEEAAAIAGQLPACDILCTHTCAYSYQKKETHSLHHGYHCLDQYIRRCRPQYHLFGHLHESGRKRIGHTDCICTYVASMLNTKTDEWVPFLREMDG
ncbi:metallophosphoesterase family protein [Bilifractor sp. LCP19S3_H10]|uniref:metallophosphoesterase family protein n=1 Tax=Bilifractor sp. LCP19S3_H10 TaxID=3438736 RepID=UPI003F8E4678